MYNVLNNELNNELVTMETEYESRFEMMLPLERLENGMKAVDARKLHNVLGSLQHFSDWIKNRIKKYGFKETFDFIREHKIMNQENSNLLRTKAEYYLSVEMAKELAMIENNEMGTKVRRYFIEIEKKAFEVEKLGEGTEININETIIQIVESMGGRFIPKEAHDRILELELKVQRLEHEAEIERLKVAANAKPERQTVRQKTINVEKTNVEKPDETLTVARGGQVEAFPETVDGMTVSKAIKRLMTETGVTKAEVITKLETLGFATQGTNGTHRWENAWAFNGGFGAYDANKNFKLNETGYAEIKKAFIVEG